MPRNNRKRNLFRLVAFSQLDTGDPKCMLTRLKRCTEICCCNTNMSQTPVKQEPIRPNIWHMFLQGRGCVGVVYFHVLLNMLGWYFIKGCVQQLNNHAVRNNKNPMPSVSMWPTNNGTKMNRSNTEPRLNLEKIYAHHCVNRTCASLIRQTRNDA